MEGIDHVRGTHIGRAPESCYDTSMVKKKSRIRFTRDELEVLTVRTRTPCRFADAMNLEGQFEDLLTRMIAFDALERRL